MKPAKVGMTANTALASWQPSGGANSQIPLPLRRGSNKPEKGTESDAPDSGDSTGKDRQRRSHPERSTLKSTILGSSSFCCASAQKEDYERLPSSRPIKKKLVKNGIAKRDSEKPGSEASAPQLPKKAQISKIRPAKVDNEANEDKCNKDSSKSPSNDGPPPTKPRGLTHPAPPIHDRRPSPRINNSSGRLQEGKRPNSELARNDTRVGPETELDSGRQKYTEVIRKLRKDPPECTPNNLASLNVQSDKLYEKVVTGQSPVTTESPKNDLMVKSCGTEDLDCPCCDSEVERDLTKRPTSQDSVSLQLSCANSSIDDQQPRADCDEKMCTSPEEPVVAEDTTKENVLELEVKALQEELEHERRHVRKQQLHILELEKEVQLMEQLKGELIKEKELRSETEQKLIVALTRDNPSTTEESEITPQTPSYSEMFNNTSPDSDEKSSPLLMGYESRIRRYQTYITKLEKDNVMLMNELKKFHDLSPGSKEEESKSMLVKLSQLERDNHQQQKEYESCLDEVANKLVHTLLMQKKLEEECKLLHLRVDQLELENAELLKILKTNDDKPEGTEFLWQSSHSSVFQNDRTSAVSVPSIPTSNEIVDDRLSDIVSPDIEEPVVAQLSRDNSCGLKTASTKPELTTGDVSPSDKPNVSSNSKIPAFNSNSTKTSPNRKRTKPDSSNTVQANHKNTRLSHSDANPVHNDVSSIKKITSPSKTTSSESTVHRITKQKLPSPVAGSAKLPSVKRKRSTKSNQGEKVPKDCKTKSTSRRQHRSAEPAHQTQIPTAKIISPFKEPVVEPVSGIKTPDAVPIVQEVWSFNCTIENDAHHLISDVMNSVKLKLETDSSTACSLKGKFAEVNDIAEKLSSSLREVESSVSTDGTHRTKDEGYSTMSSDLQQDSAADTTVSEHEDPSLTFLAPGSRFVSDDSVTECLDGSMTSSSDSGFGPLQQIVLTSHVQLSPSSESKLSALSSATKNSNSGNNLMISTISTYLSDYSQRNSDMIRPDISVGETTPCGVYTQSCFFPPDPSVRYNGMVIPNNSNDFSLRTLCKESENCPEPLVLCDVNSFSVKDFDTSNRYSQTSFGSSDGCRSVIECVPCDSEFPNKKQELGGGVIETAEKATLTEPEEETWREKALAHFIDESIWSLYSSESDTQFRCFSTDIGAEVSPLESLEASCPPSVASPSIVITGPGDTPESTCADNFIDAENASTQINSEFTSLLLSKSGIQDSEIRELDFSWTKKSNLERVASDSLLYQKDAVHELEDSLKPGLKTTRHFTSSRNNIPLVHHLSLSDVCHVALSPPSINDHMISPEILLNLEKTMLQNNYVWPSSVNASRSSSLCSLPSSNSCQVISDETDDADIVRQSSRKGSQDPDLSSASDAEYENLEHKDFVERWIQKEITQRTDLPIHKFDPGEKLEKRFLPSVKKKNFRPFSHNQIDSGFLHSPSSFSWTKGTARKGNTFDETKRSVNSYDDRLHHPIPTPDFIAENICSEDVTSLASSSSIVYPIIFTCENLEDDIEPSNGMHEIEADLQLLDSDLKEFNDDFYRLCDVATSSLSLDRSHLPVILERFDHLETSCPASPAMNRNNIGQNPHCPPEFSSYSNKPTGLVKPMRPLTLTFCDVPKNVGFYRFQKKDLGEKVVQIEETLNKDLTHSLVNPADVKDCRKDDIFHHRRNSDSISCSRTIKERCETRQNTVFRSLSQPGSEIEASCSYPSTKPPGIPSVNQNIIDTSAAKPRSKSNALHADSIICATENPRLVPVRKCYNKLRSGVSSPEKSCKSGLPSPKDNGVISKRHQWRKDRKQQNSKEGCGTAWIHLHANPTLSDPKARASFLDSMVETLSSSGSSSEEEDDFPVVHSVQSNSHLQRICREKRQRIKASRGEEFIAVSPRHRSSVINRQSLYFRFGDQEKAAISCFDFLEEIPIAASEPGSLETFTNKRLIPPGELDTTGKRPELKYKERVNLVSPCNSETKFKQSCSNNSYESRLRVPVLWNRPLCHNMSSSTLNSQDCEILDHLSLSDSCAESYSSTPDSFEDGS